MTDPVSSYHIIGSKMCDMWLCAQTNSEAIRL